MLACLLASIQKRTSPVKFAHLAEKSGNGSISNLSTKVSSAYGRLSHRRTAEEGGLGGDDELSDLSDDNEGPLPDDVSGFLFSPNS